MDFLDAVFKIQIWPTEDLNEALVWVVSIALIIFAATALLRIWWTLSTWELRRRKLRLEVEREEQHAGVASSKDR